MDILYIVVAVPETRLLMFEPQTVRIMVAKKLFLLFVMIWFNWYKRFWFLREGLPGWQLHAYQKQTELRKLCCPQQPDKSFCQLCTN